MPPAHVALALARVHEVPHAVQFASVFSGASQPFAPFPSQLSQPVSQLVIVHIPVLQLSVALSLVHGVPQPPQFVSVFVGVSQPLPVAPSQFP